MGLPWTAFYEVTRPAHRPGPQTSCNRIAQSGAGEAASAPVAAVLANAVYDVTGVRLRSVPFTAERVKAALAKTL
jgi:CO/xanthine dehydrogenase Mo-binding subunit